MSERPNLPSFIKEAELTDVCGAFLVFISLLVLAGWLSGFQPLTSFSIDSSLPTMKVNTAIGFLMLGMGLFALGRNYRQPIALSAITVLLISGCALVEHRFGIVLGVNDLFIDDNWSVAAPGRMSLATAISFGFAATLLLTHGNLSVRHPHLYNLLLFLFALQPLVIINAYISDIELLSRSTLFSTFSLPTTVAFSLFFVGIIGASQHGALGLLNGTSKIARMFRWTFFTIILMSIALGGITDWLIQDQIDHQLVATAFLHSTIVLSLLFIFGLGFLHLSAMELQISLEKVSSARLNNDEHALLDIFSASDDGIILVDERRRIMRVNEGAGSIFGWQLEDLLGKPLETLMPERYRKKDIGMFHDFLLSNDRTRCFDDQGKTLGLTRQGYEKHLSISLHKCRKISASGDIIELHAQPQEQFQTETEKNHKQEKATELFAVAIFRELGGLETEMAELKRHQHIDKLTGLPNNEEFERYSQKFASQTPRKDDSYTCLMVIDLDSFKLINKRHSRDFGDRVLQTITTTLKHRLRTTDKLFRYQADEFVMVSANTPPAEAELMAERMRTSVKVSPTKMEGRNVYVTCSIGVIVTNEVGFDLKQTIQQLSESVHESREICKDKVTIFS
ncbi:sensor domain-containing diguanylate cyclase [Teredinibacter franksiae]|uniref:sensor domain-containing diguanylate cyclase n=1 Tax=Teredinibacter franksiae TaxID=2761453 RepID=UPI00162AC1DE|nr:sensor domain-containing diguanylate cyclase [Teredinibacter franksiae]